MHATISHNYWKVSEEVAYLQKRTNKDAGILLTSDSSDSRSIRD